MAQGAWFNLCLAVAPVANVYINLLMLTAPAVHVHLRVRTKRPSGSDPKQRCSTVSVTNSTAVLWLPHSAVGLGGWGPSQEQDGVAKSRRLLNSLARRLCCLCSSLVAPPLPALPLATPLSQRVHVAPWSRACARAGRRCSRRLPPRTSDLRWLADYDQISTRFIVVSIMSLVWLLSAGDPRQAMCVGCVLVVI